jgi:hypothetical protein
MQHNVDPCVEVSGVPKEVLQQECGVERIERRETNI